MWCFLVAAGCHVGSYYTLILVCGFAVNLFAVIFFYFVKLQFKKKKKKSKSFVVLFVVVLFITSWFTVHVQEKSVFAPLNWHLIFMEAFESFDGHFVVPGSLSQDKLVQTSIKSPSRAEKSWWGTLNVGTEHQEGCPYLNYVLHYLELLQDCSFSLTSSGKHYFAPHCWQFLLWG